MSRDTKRAQSSDLEPVAPAVAPTPPPPAASYGIMEAIELMRHLPADLRLTDIMVQVVKRTLESAHVSVAGVIVDATRREEQIEARIRALQGEIAGCQREIETRTAEIAGLQAELGDVSRVIERFG